MRKLAAAVLLTLTACGLMGGCASAGSSPFTSAPAGPREPDPAAQAPVLAATTFPDLAVTNRQLTADVLAADAPVGDIRSRLLVTGFVGGRERTFQGPSRNLTLVVSRVLVFRDAAGAAAYLAFVRSHADAYFGIATGAGPVTTAGRTGWMFQPAECACHLANPLLVAILRDRSRLVWLSINGPQATSATLLALLAPGRSSSA